MESCFFYLEQGKIMNKHGYIVEVKKWGKVLILLKMDYGLLKAL